MLTSKFDRDLIFNFVGFGVLAFSGVLINLLLAYFRGSEALGVFNQVFAIHLILSQISVLGLQFSVLKQVSEQQLAPWDASSSLFSALVIVIPLSAVVTVVLFFLAPVFGSLLQSEKITQGIKFLIPGFFFFAINKVLLMSLNGMRHMRAYALFNSGRYLLILVALIVLLIKRVDDVQLVLSITIAEVTLFAFFVAYVFGRLFRGALALPVWSRMREHFSFGLKASLSGMLIELNTRVDLLMLGLFFSDKIVGIYSFAATLAEGFKQIPSIMRWNIDPLLGQMFKDGLKGDIEALVKRVREKYLPMFMVFCFVSMLFYPLALNIFSLDQNFGSSWAVFSILLVAVALSAFYSPFNGVLLQGGVPEIQSLITLITTIFNISANYLLIPPLGLYGAAIATGGAFILDALLIAYFSKRLVGVRL